MATIDNTFTHDTNRDDDHDVDIVIPPQSSDIMMMTKTTTTTTTTMIEPIVTPNAIGPDPAITITPSSDGKVTLTAIQSPPRSSTSNNGSRDTGTIRKVFGSTFTPINNNSPSRNYNNVWNTPDGSNSVVQTPNTGSGSGGGLSELSKQLRVYQSRNEGYVIEIDRLERQLRILSDLQGISVADIRTALQLACESEAHGELQHRVASLRAQLEAATVINHTKRGSDSHQQQHQQVTQSTTTLLENEISNLQLRIGELEEIDNTRTNEIQRLYNKLLEQKDENSKLQALYSNAVQDSENAAAAFAKERETFLSQHHSTPIVQPLVLPPQDDTNERIIIEQNEKIKQLEQQIIELRRQLQQQQDKYTIRDEQNQAIDEENKLRLAQYKARFVVQDERIKDLEQQLSSLYTAFHFVSEERNQDILKHAELKSNLEGADEQVARQVKTIEEQGTNRTNITSTGQVSTDPGYDSSLAGTSTTTTKPVPSLTNKGHTKKGDQVMGGILLIRSSNALGMKKWKKRIVTLTYYSNYYVFHIDKDTKYKLNKHLSRIETYKKQPYAIIIRTNYMDSTAPSLYVAAEDRQQYNQWLAALELATAGLVVLQQVKEDSKLQIDSTSTKFTGTTMGPSPVIDSYISPEDQEALDIAQAIEESEREQIQQQQQQQYQQRSSTTATTSYATSPEWNESSYNGSISESFSDSKNNNDDDNNLSSNSPGGQYRYKHEQDEYDGVSEHKSEGFNDGDSSSSYLDHVYERYGQPTPISNEELHRNISSTSTSTTISSIDRNGIQNNSSNSNDMYRYDYDNTEEENQRLQSFLHEALLAPNNETETVSNKGRGLPVVHNEI